MNSRARRRTIAVIATAGLAVGGLGMGAVTAQAEKPSFHTCRVSSADNAVWVTVPTSVTPGRPGGAVQCQVVPV